MADILWLRKRIEALGKFQGKLLAEWLNRKGANRKAGKTDPMAALVEGLLYLDGGGHVLAASKEEARARFIAPLASSCVSWTQKWVAEIRPSDWGCDFLIRVSFGRVKNHLAFVPVGQRGAVLLALKNLWDLGQADRLHLCPNCRRWFFARRVDSKLCSQSCQESAWRKSPPGRKFRAAYMKDYREKVKKLWEAKP